MDRKSANPAKKNQAETRRERLKVALKANLKRRKAQAQVRRSGAQEHAPKKD